MQVNDVLNVKYWDNPSETFRAQVVEIKNDWVRICCVTRYASGKMHEQNIMYPYGRLIEVSTLVVPCSL